MKKTLPPEAISLFESSCQYLGIPVHDRTRSVRKGKAGMGFLSLSLDYPRECDIWIGLAISNGLTEDIIDNIIRTWTTYNNLQSQVKLAPRTLTLSYDSGVYLTFPVQTFDQLKLARASFMIKNHKYHEAYEIISEIKQKYPTMFEALWMDIVINYQTKRWTDVLTLVSNIEYSTEINKDVKAKFKKELTVVKAVASAHLGHYHLAYSLLSDPEAQYTNTSWDALLTKALVLRAQHDEDQARYHLEKLYSFTNDKKISDILANPSYKLEITTQAQILARTDPWDPTSEPEVSEEELKKKQERKERLLEEADRELEKFIGLQPVKDQVNRLRNTIAVAQERKARSLSSESRSQHLVFAGPPGTGKTTIARVIAKIYSGLGVIEKETITEVNRAEIVGQVIGETEAKMNSIIDQALDGILFIDEAYALVSTGAKNDFGLVAINTLLARMENDRSRLVVIIAGYPNDLNKFLSANEGLRSRFSRMIEFESYTPDELVEMTTAISKRRDTIFSEEALHAVRALCQELADIELEDSFKVKRRALDLAGNARFVRNIIERSEEERDDRVGKIRDLSTVANSDLVTITEKDVIRTSRVLLQNLGIKIDDE